MRNILGTAGAGYIGSHTCLELLKSNYEVVVVDDLSNSVTESLSRVEKLAGGKKITFYQVDILDREGLDAVFKKEANIDAVIHFAAKKAVGESVEKPLYYYENNITGSLSLFEVMKNNNVDKIVFSSSATVYGDPHTVPIVEDFPLSATNPYGQSKLMVEYILRDAAKANPQLKTILLRYFNPVGAHASATIGEHPQGIPNNLMPYISQVAIGQREQLSVFGSDYDTPDGTGVRDYIHVVDLAKGHVKALEAMNKVEDCTAVNLGTGQGYSVLEMVNAFTSQTGQKVPYELVDRRPGDIATCYADPKFAQDFLGWKAEKGLDEMMKDTWAWQEKNPNGFS